MLKFALVGCGRISSKHADSLVNHIDNAELIAVSDPQGDRAEVLGKKYGVNYYKDYVDMLNKEDVDIVSILTESGNHAKHAIDVVKRFKKHILVEKPMALTLKDADEMIRVCDENGVKLFVVKQNRYNLPVMKVREALESGKFGRMVMGTVRVRWCRPQRYYDQDEWRGTWEMDGGVFTNQASHHVDLLEWMLGEPVSVFAKSRTALADIETEDTGVAIIKFESGALGVVEATTAVRPKDLEGSLSLMGEKGSIEIGGFAVNELKTWNFEGESIEDLEMVKENPPNVYGFGHIRYIQNVCDSILEDKKALVDGLAGRKSLELINAIYESIETGKEVFLRFQPKRCRLGEKR
ncbi:MAG: oxidoreductase [Candidatus Cloacimonadota bacterium]|nr:MAG: oxidoreductase [Candidatus Cloacimonadota bacterium]PIE79303.1 MAG: oxidoreductase [Candidatus Delongbacteria bacterium]